MRWTQLNALLPAMQFSVAPWDVSREADLFCTAALEVREKLKDVLLKVCLGDCVVWGGVGWWGEFACLCVCVGV